jgi:hypothetical protein
MTKLTDVRHLLSTTFLLGGCVVLAGVLRLTPALSADWEKVRQQGMMQLVLVAKARERDRPGYQEAIASLCRPGQRCYLLFWSDRAMVPVKLPMTDRELKAQIGAYTRNPSTGLDELVLSCRFGRAGGNCI